MCADGTFISIGPLVQRCLHGVPRSSLVISYQDKHILVSTELLQHNRMWNGHLPAACSPAPDSQSHGNIHRNHPRPRNELISVAMNMGEKQTEE